MDEITTLNPCMGAGCHAGCIDVIAEREFNATERIRNEMRRG
jgi:hypothetical protein